LPPSVGVVIVTYNSERFLDRCLDAVARSTTAPTSVVVVDNASRESWYLDRLATTHPNVRVIRHTTNVGFAAANNIGIDALAALDVVLVLNPDAFVSPSFLGDAAALMEQHPEVGALNPKLLQADPTTFAPTGRIDCAGILHTWYGAVYDRGQGQADQQQYDRMEDVPALCGAAMLCRMAALNDVAPDGEYFDESFFMYKEDIDLSYRLRRAGWRTLYAPQLVVHHCRGNTQVDRASTPPWVRRRSVANEWRLWRKRTLPRRVRIPMFGYLVLKSIAVALGR
jgi:GT2 family glycosyltransferase